MSALRIAFALAVLAVATGCATMHGHAQTSAFVVIRHAEKASDDPRDPTLSAAGTARAQSLAGLLRGEPLVAAYATGFRRTQLTAAPSARAAGIEVSIYDANLPAVELARQLRARHARGTVLVVGHSNTAPAIAAALCGCEVPAMAEDAFNLIHRIEIDHAGRARLRSTRY